MIKLICDVSPEVDRFHLRTADTEYQLCAVEGRGGVFRGNALALVVFIRRESRHDDASPIRILTQHQAYGDQWVDVPANQIEIVEHHPKVVAHG